MDLTKDSDSDDERKEISRLNRLENKKNKKSGGFQSMGLSEPVFKGILFKGYKIPTPIQRKTIPVIMEGRDVVAMARTGSGKTAAFLIPMLESFKRHDPTGVRGIILSPTRELAMQTHKFAKEIGKFTRLKFAVILGGDKIENQFEAIHQNPDVLIATPGRLMHILLEMNVSLNKVQYVVLDEADRLFEMGFKEQLHEILKRVPETRQTLLFSATLPKMIVEFASAGLSNPQLIRLDVESKLSDMLKLHFLECRSEDKIAVLLHLLHHVVTPSQLTVVFVATKHHVEYLNMILTKAGHSCSVGYSTMDPKARQINVTNFRNGTTKILIVTDLAARGIDIPHLDNVINVNFPAKSKLFLHRVGRVARAGRSGSAYSLISSEEKAYVVDLHLFLGKPLTFASHEPSNQTVDQCGLYGKVPQTVIDFEEENLRKWNQNSEFAAMAKVASNAYDKYIRTRPTASSESIKRCKSMRSDSLAYHPLFGENKEDEEREKLLKALKSYKSNTLKASNSVFQVRPQHKSSKIADSSFQDKDEQLMNAKKRKVKDDEFYLDYVSKDYQSEQGYIGSAFEKEASTAMIDMQGDDEEEQNKRKKMVWDRKKKKYVKNSEVKIRTESGKKVQGKNIKRDLYKTWLERKKIKHKDDDDEDVKPTNFNRRRGSKDRFNGKGINQPKSELKSKGQIVKKREKLAKVKQFQKKQKEKRDKRRGKK